MFRMTFHTFSFWDQLRTRYIELFGEEPTTDGVLDQIQAQLGVTIPRDFRTISSFYSGGMVGGISHHAIATQGPATNVVTETLRLRESIALPHSLLVLAEPVESLVILATDHSRSQPAVIWIDSIDASNLNNVESLHNPQTWSSYADFFEFLLDREVEERG